MLTAFVQTDPGLVEACGAEPGIICDAVYGLTGNSTAAEFAQLAAKPINALLILLAAWILNRIVRKDKEPPVVWIGIAIGFLGVYVILHPGSESFKLSSWWGQIGESGCVGCGRCISWCPVGIDLVEEANVLSAEAVLAAGGPEEAGSGGPEPGATQVLLRRREVAGR